MAQLFFLLVIVIWSANGLSSNRNVETVDASICNSLPHGTKIPNPVDCSSFYVCDRDFPEIMHCSDGLLFDVNLKVCNWPHDTTCVFGSLPHKPEKQTLPPKLPSNNEQPTLPPNTEIFNPFQIGCSRDGIYYLPHPFKCDYYFICVSRTLHQNYCGIDMYWDYSKQRCDHPENAICYSNIAAANSIPTVSPISSTKPETNSPIFFPQSTTATSTTLELTTRQPTTVDSPSVKPATATPVIETLTNKTTSSVFQSSEFSMSDSLKTTITASSKENESNQEEEEDLSQELITNEALEAPPQNPMDGYNPDQVRCIHEGFYFLPHPTNCEMYFICINHTMHLHQCGSNIHWDYVKNKCAAPTAYRCYAFSNKTAAHDDETIEENIVDDPLEEFNPDYVRCVHSGFYYLPHPTACNLYFVCNNYTLNLFRCDAMATWHYLNEQCSSTNIKCYYEATHPTTTEKPITVMTQDPEELIDPMEGYDPDNVQCLRGGLYFLPHPTNCAIYFVCVNRTLNLHRCGNGIFWNYPDQRCDLRENAKCFKPKNTTTTTTTTKTTTTTTTAATPTPTTTQATTTSTTPKPRPTVGVFMPFEVEDFGSPHGKDDEIDVLPKCPKHQAFYPHTRNCQKYYICIGGVPILTKCPDDLYWDPQERMCGLPSHTKCSVERRG